MKIHKLPYGPIEANCYIIESSSKSFMIDPCIDIKYIPETASSIEAVLITHCHFDHIANMVNIKKELNVSFYAHRLEFPSFSDPQKNGSVYFMDEKIFPKPDFEISADLEFKIDEKWTISFIHTPGHSYGSICILLSENKIIKYCFTGDTLFKESAGRTDLGGNPALLKNSLEKLKSMEDSVVIFPGHGPKSTIGYEKTNNPFM